MASPLPLTAAMGRGVGAAVHTGAHSRLTAGGSPRRRGPFSAVTRAPGGKVEASALLTGYSLQHSALSSS